MVWRWLRFVGGNVIADLTPFAKDAAAADTLLFMRDGKWRKARDTAKNLCKKDRERYLPLLVEANAGLAREMMRKGLTKDALTVIDYLVTIASPERVAELRAELEKPPTETAEAAVGLGSVHWLVALQAAAAKEVSAKDFAAIDALVTDGFRPVDGAGEAADQLAAELAAVRTACAATGDGRWDEAREALRALPRESIFRHWRMFLRGTRCVFEDDPETARKCFAELPADGALARAARVLDPALAIPGPEAPKGARIAFFLAATGQPATWVEPLLEAEALWKSGKRHQAFTGLCKSLKGAFPSDQPGLASELTDAMMPFRGKMSDDDSHDAENLLEWVGKAGRPANLMGTVVRAGIVGYADPHRLEMLEKEWALVLKHLTQRDGADSQRDAIAWQWFGEMALKIAGQHRGIDSDDFDGDDWDDWVDDDDFNDGVIGYGPARKAFEKSLEYDSDHPDTWLALLGVISKEGDSKEHNRVLGEVAKRFPDDKRVLVLAGREALTRKTYTKALKALEAAHEHDPLDREIKALIVTALTAQAVEHRKKKKSSAEVWDRMESLLEDRPDVGQMGMARWVARVRRGLLDHDRTAAEAAMKDADRLAPSAAERLHWEDVLRNAYKLPWRKTVDAEWQAALVDKSMGWLVLPRLIALGNLGSPLTQWNQEVEIRFSIRMLGAIRVLIERKSATDLDELLQFLDVVRELWDGPESIGLFLLDEIMDALLPALKLRVSGSKKKLDPRLRLAYLAALEATRNHITLTPQQFLNLLDSVIKDGEKLGLGHAVAHAHRIRIRLGGQYELSNSSQYDPYGDDDDDDDFDDGPETMEELQEMIEQLAAESPELAAEAARALEMMVDEAIANFGDGKKFGKKQPPRKRRSDAVDPNQFDLF